MTALLARVVVAAMFGVSATAKLTDRHSVRAAVVEFGVPGGIAGPVGWALVIAELATAVLLVLGGMWARLGAGAAVVLLLAFSGAVALNLTRGRSAECHCFGRLSAGPAGWPAVARNAMFAALAAFVALGGQLGWPLLALAPVLFGLWVIPTWRKPWARRAGTGAQGLSLADPTGQVWTLDALLAPTRPLLLVFTQPGCPACDALLPDIARWQYELDGRVTVAVVSGGPAGRGLIAASESGLRHVLVDHSRSAFGAYAVSATPSAALIDTDQTLAADLALGAGEIDSLVGRALQVSEEPTFTRRGILGRAAFGFASVSILPAFAAIASACGSSSANRASPTTVTNKDALEVDGAWLCNQTFALCTTAPCVPSKTDPNISICRCVVQNGYSIGFKSCTERAQSGTKLVSEFSTVNVNPSFGIMSCPSGVPWANCLDVVCDIDPTDPAQALCQCKTVRTGESLTFGGGCDTSTCTSTVWSATTTNLPGNAQYIKGMKQLNQSVTFPKTCPSTTTTVPPTSSTTS
jgi:thiol-disulfide isomerase/thioredoxin